MGVLSTAAFAPEVGAADTSCTGPVGAVTIKGNVSAGPGCDLSGAIVNGDVTVTPGGSLATSRESTTTIEGDVRASSAAFIDLERATVTGNVVLDGTTGTRDVPTAVTFELGTVGGNVDIKNGVSEIVFEDETVDGNVIAHSNRGVPPAYTSARIQFFEDGINGDLTILGNSLTGGADNTITVVEGFRIGGNLLIANNSLVTSQPDFSPNHIFVTEAEVTGNLLLLGNTESTLSGDNNIVGVNSTTITSVLVCQNNNPEPTGTDNTAARKTGQCASL